MCAGKSGCLCDVGEYTPLVLGWWACHCVVPSVIADDYAHLLSVLCLSTKEGESGGKLSVDR